MVRPLKVGGIQFADDLLELGHTARSCPEEASEITSRIEVKCVNCEEVGHRARDCTTPRVDKFACRNCKYVEANVTS
jgi:hypothetical protein